MITLETGDILEVKHVNTHVYGRHTSKGTVEYTFELGDFVVVDRVHRFGIVGYHFAGGHKVHIGWADIAVTFTVAE